jgi:hypothetical protein
VKRPVARCLAGWLSHDSMSPSFSVNAFSATAALLLIPSRSRFRARWKNSFSPSLYGVTEPDRTLIWQRASLRSSVSVPGETPVESSSLTKEWSAFSATVVKLRNQAETRLAPDAAETGILVSPVGGLVFSASTSRRNRRHSPWAADPTTIFTN